MDRDELIKELVNDIRDLGVDFRPAEHLDTVAVMNVTRNIGAYDKHRATPKDIAHEYYHKVFNHRCRGSEYDIRNEQERICNENATKLLWHIFLREGGSIEYSQHFLEISGCDDYWLDRIIDGNPYEGLLAY